MSLPTVAVVGVGLIGGSLGQAWRRAKAAHVIGVARRAESVEAALAAEAIDEGTTSLAEAAAAADVLVLCTPVLQIVPLALDAAVHMRKGTMITDAGSTKGEICRALWPALPPHITFIGGHPMAGSERTGVGAADPYLYENAVYCLTPPAAMPDGHPQLELLLKLVRATGARPLLLDPQVHDLIVAGISHMPHIVAAALVNAVATQDSGDVPMLQLAAGGFRDTTRIASGSPDVWRDICLANRQAILQMLNALTAALDNLRDAVDKADSNQLMRLFDQARQVRSTIPTRAKGLMGVLHEITVIIADKPGAIHAITGLLAQAELNIVDIEILRVREGEGGTIRLALADDNAVDTALRILQQHGYTARRR